jgi:hypothetical protein
MDTLQTALKFMGSSFIRDSLTRAVTLLTCRTIQDAFGLNLDRNIIFTIFMIVFVPFARIY